MTSQVETYSKIAVHNKNYCSTSVITLTLLAKGVSLNFIFWRRTISSFFTSIKLNRENVDDIDGRVSGRKKNGERYTTCVSHCCYNQEVHQKTLYPTLHLRPWTCEKRLELWQWISSSKEKDAASCLFFCFKSVNPIWVLRSRLKT